MCEGLKQRSFLTVFNFLFINPLSHKNFNQSIYLDVDRYLYKNEVVN